MRVAVLLIALALLVPPVARASGKIAEQASSFSGTDTDDDRTMQGMVDAHAQKTVAQWLRANPHRDLKLHLGSPGGSVKFGMMMYSAIGAHGRVSTDVRPGEVCLSACSYIWLAGRVRTVADRAELGFHSSFCTGPCDTRGIGLINQLILDTLARTEPALAVLVSMTGAMIVGNRLIALARWEGGHWAMRTFEPPTSMAQR